MCFRETLEGCKQTCMGDSGQDSEDQNTNRNTGCEEKSKEVSVWNQGSINSWNSGHVCYTMAENLSVLPTSSDI